MQADAALKFGIMASGQMPDELPDPGVFRNIAETAEGLGYDSLWVGDHLAFGHPILEGSVALGAFAGYTHTITLGTGVLLLPLRHPGLVAKQMASLDYLTGGRLIVGVGVGGDSPKDFEIVQSSRSERGARTNEGIRVMQALWSQPSASFHGKFYDFDDVAINPKPHQSDGPPIWVGGRAEAALRRAGGLADGWLAYMVSPDSYRSRLETVRQAASEAGRDPTRISAAMMVPTRVAEDGAAARESLAAHLTQRYNRPFDVDQIERICLAGNPEEIHARVGEYAAAGVEHLVFLYGGAPSDAAAQFEMLYETVVTPTLENV
ncbi:MAG: TIGR03619 family F420-dependent LLM class oxidoreductase [Acidimicrobiia bacterium]|nr:TIGR03619 family F420-dependent LLM class oxidoreductase [Acidimicrobiia bacterium]